MLISVILHLFITLPYNRINTCQNNITNYQINYLL